jgi:hypothetical protein
MTKKLTIEMLCSKLKYHPEKGLGMYGIDELEQIAKELELKQQMPNIVKAIYKETKARRWLLNRDAARGTP